MEVDAAPGIDLAQMMENMRQQYEILAEKNRQEAKDRFDKLVMLVYLILYKLQKLYYSFVCVSSCNSSAKQAFNCSETGNSS